MKAAVDRRVILRRLVDEALSSFGIECFWNIRTDLDTVPQAKLVASRLRKHGGARGLRFAAAIERELEAMGEAAWR